MNEAKEYYIERFNADKIKDLENLFVAVYKKKSAEGYFSKKYDTDFTGCSYIGYIAYKQKIPIAFYAVIPCFIQHENDKILAAQSADTMTHPEHRYKSLFSELSKMCFDLCKQNNITVLFGFPNQNSHHGAIKLGWQLTEVMECFQINVKQKTYKKILNKIDKGHTDRVLKKYITSEKGLTNSVIKDGFSGVYRDKNYLQYKTYSKTYVLKIGEAKIWVSIGGSLTIGDMLCNENDFNDAINAIKKIAINLGVLVIYFHACKGTSLHKLFSEKFQSIPSFAALFQNFTNYIDIKKIKFTFADVDIF
jgi:hypothetical protein